MFGRRAIRACMLMGEIPHPAVSAAATAKVVAAAAHAYIGQSLRACAAQRLARTERRKW